MSIRKVLTWLTMTATTAVAAALPAESSNATEEVAPYSVVTRKTMASLLRTPLEAPSVEVSVHRRWKEEGLVFEDLSWPSLDGETVPAFLIRPEEEGTPRPAVVCLHGSSGSRESMTTREFGPGEWTRFGRDAPHTRMLGWARELARRGYVTLSITQRGLDQRTPDTNDQSKELLLFDRNLMGAIVHEIRQGISLLESRPEVDPGRIAAAGMSFGGITSFYSWLIDERLLAAAPICGGVGSLKTFLELGSRSYHGLYWWVPGMLLHGDHGDFAASLAPRPLMLWAPRDDIGMPSEGVERFLESAAPAYRRADAQDSLVVHRPPGGHTFSLEAFEALAEFLKWAMGPE